ncbi:ABC-type sugar transport system ATPase subunit [Ignavibacterium album JCM 16511]|uniref:ABC-type sugar transport system ATPase subunit n=1 Tax=Ignavibacterium album (strain DSM 19864 / JCM 16511 / NBRC 101810 / Mat9-16) TaxID=945713 RepID=I0AIU5_IGNAJ|nr:sn-glycerol-3-phosphate ABC transporter ATP-binding protein UgpC [Ignavibacterium album]AFH48902.1 ABC-type sugar transport system ATPase subunit [Ignavibacterium album JCM 16511]
MAEVILKNVSKIYDDKTKAVDNVNITIADKEFIVLVGPSGCGKTTTLRMIAGLEDISEGEILIDGKVINNLPPKDRDIAMVFQNYALYPHMSVYENLAFGLKLRKLDKHEIDKRVNEAARILGLEKYLDRKPKALSGGQRQRVAVGRAIVRNPKVFLFDEPLSNLDAKLRVQMRTEISRLHKELGATMIYVTHDQIEAMTMGDRIVVMKDGCVQQIDTPLNLYNLPANKFVAGFIGSPSMNFIKGEIAEENFNLFFQSTFGNLKFIIPDEKKNSFIEKKIKKVWLGIRPENIHLTNKDKPSVSVASLKSEILLIEPLGNQTLIYFNFENNQLVSEHHGFISISKGTIHEFLIDLNKIHFFDEESEMRIT